MTTLLPTISVAYTGPSTDQPPTTTGTYGSPSTALAGDANPPTKATATTANTILVFFAQPATARVFECHISLTSLRYFT